MLLICEGHKPGEIAAAMGLSSKTVSNYRTRILEKTGWRSDAGLVEAWAGGRAGYERLGGSIGLGGAAASPWSAHRLWAGGLVGLAMGFRHVFVALELDAAYQQASASIGSTDVRVRGLTLAPSGALQGRF